MGKLVYSMSLSLDGYVETLDHSLAWANVDEEIHCWYNERSRNADAFLYGRQLYTVMSAYWPTAERDPDATDYVLEFAQIWNSKPKIVFSTTLTEVQPGCRLVRGDVAVELAKLRKEFAGELWVGGPTLAAQFITRGLVDEYRLVVHPVMLGEGTSFFPRLRRPLDLRLIERQEFASGALYLGYVPA